MGRRRRHTFRTDHAVATNQGPAAHTSAYTHSSANASTSTSATATATASASASTSRIHTKRLLCRGGSCAGRRVRGWW